MSSFNPPRRNRPDRVKARTPPPAATPPQSATKPSAPSNHSDSDDDPQTFHDARFPPEQESQLLSESHDLKATANAQFAASDFNQAISTYDRAIAACPNYLDYEIAVLQSNIAACHLRLKQWREAIGAADQALDALDREDPPPKPKKESKSAEQRKKKATPKHKQPHQPSSKHRFNDLNSSDSSEDDEFLPAHTQQPDPIPPTAGPPPAVVELPSSSDDESSAEALRKLNLSDQRHQDITRIRTKALLRRARARIELGRQLSQEGKGMFSGPSNDPEDRRDRSESPWPLLSSAQDDYNNLLSPSGPYFTHLPASDRRQCQLALTQLPAEVEAAKQRETAEMMGKLKELGNGILRPFGLNTDMFKFVKDENTGGYSVNFDQGGGRK